jgi:peptidoglycan/LPS O-acetylase OafA/YrhL
MHIRNNRLLEALPFLVGAALGWVVVHAQVRDARLQVIFLMAVAAVTVITSVMLGRLLHRGRDVKISSRRLAWVIALFAVVVGLGYLLGYLGSISVNSWLPLLIGALAVLFVFFRRKRATTRKEPPEPPPENRES